MFTIGTFWRSALGFPYLVPSRFAGARLERPGVDLPHHALDAPASETGL